MPIAQGQVVHLLQPVGIEPQQVVGIGRMFVVGVAGATQFQIRPPEALDGTMGEHQPRFIGRQGPPVELAQPITGIETVTAPQ